MPYTCMEYINDNFLDCPNFRELANFARSGPLSLPKEKRPREKLIRAGPETLSDQELLSIILIAGIRGKNVTIMARELLLKLDKEKNIPSVTELDRVTGIGIAKACTIVAMLEFGRRKWEGGQKIRQPEDIFNIIRHHADRRQEKFLCLSLNGAHEILAVRIVTIGLVNKTIIHPREVFADPIHDRASAIIVAHNHPSGNVQPSAEDEDITQRLKASADLLGIAFLDHLIFTEKNFFSFRQGKILCDKGKKT